MHIKTTLAHMLAALAIFAPLTFPSSTVHANAAEARRSAKAASKVFNDEGVFVVDQASGVVPFRGTGDYVTFMTAGVKYFVLVSGDSNVEDIGVSLWGPKKSNGRFRLVHHEGLKENSDIQPYRLMAVKPRVSGLYLIRLHLIDGDRDGAHVYTLIGIGS